MKKVNGLTNRIAAMLLSGMLIVGSVPGNVLASDIQTDIGQTSEIAPEEVVEMPSEDVLEEDSAEEEMGADVVPTEEEMGEEAASAEEEMNSEEASTEKNSEDAAAQEEETITSYTVTLDANGGYFANEWDDAMGETVETTNILTKAIPVGGGVSTFPVREQENASVSFLGWSLERDGEIVSQGYEEYIPVDNCVLYAVWQADEIVAESEEASWGETDSSDAQDIEFVDEGTDQADASQEFEDTGVVEETEAETENADSVEGDETGLVAPEISEETAFEDAEVAKGEETIQESDDTETAEIPEAAQEIEVTEIIEEPEAGQKSEETEIAVISDSEKEVVDTDTAEEPVTFQESEDTEVEGETEERFVDDVAASDVYIVPETEGENATTDQQAIVLEQEEIYADEEVENTSEESSGPSITEEETNPDLVESSKEEEIVGEDAAMGVVESGTCGENLTWTLDEEGTLTISGTGEMYDFSRIKIGTYSGLLAGDLPPWFDERDSIERIVINEGVASIGNGAFTQAGENDILESISIPRSITSIGISAFAYTGCSQIEFVSDSVEFRTYGDQGPFVYAKFDNVVLGCEELPSGVFGYSTIKKITLTENVKTISDSAFSHCNSLTSIDIPNGVTSIGNNAFYQCDALTSITIPSSVKSLGKQAFYLCDALKSVRIQGGITTIESQTFSDCGALEEVVINQGVENIEDMAFRNCGNLKSLSLPVGLKNIGYAAFSGCTSLDNLIIPEGTITIGELAFWGCNLNSATLPSSLMNIESKAFGSCKNLKSISIPKNVKKIVCETNDGISYASFFQADSLLEIKVDPENSTYKSFDGCLYNSDLKELLYCPRGKESVTISPSTTTISDHIIGGYNSLGDHSIIKEIYFGTNSPSLSDYVFSGLTATAYYNNFLNNWPADKRQNYGGTITWTEKPLNLSECTMTISPTSYTYDGTAKKPTITIKYNGTNLTNNTDYSVFYYSNNINVGTGTVAVTGKGNFTGQISKAFTINKAAPSLSFASSSVSKTTTDNAFTNTLTKKTDGAITFSSSNTSVASVNSSSGLVTIKGAGSATITANAAAGTNYNAGSASYTLTVVQRIERYLDASDIFSFSNSYTHFGYSNYYISDKDFLQLSNYVRSIYKNDSDYANSVINNMQQLRNSSWGGSCYGMAVTTILDKINAIGFNENFDPTAKTMSEVHSPADNTSVKSAINYYFLAQRIPYLRLENVKSYDKGESDWRAGLKQLVSMAQEGTPILFCYWFSGGGHAIVIKGYEKATDGGHNIIAYDNRYPNRDVVVYVDSNYSKCIIDENENATGIEYVKNMSAFDAIDIDGPGNQYQGSYIGGSISSDNSSTQITVRSRGRITIENAEGQTLVIDNGIASGTMEIANQYMIVAETENGDDNSGFTYMVSNSDSFTFESDNGEIDASVVSSGVYGSAITSGADYVVISSNRGVYALGDDFSYSLSLAVNNDMCDMVSIDGNSNNDVKLLLQGDKVKATGIDTNSGIVTVYSNTIDTDLYSYLQGYKSIVIIPSGSGEAGDVNIMGSSKENGIYDTNIGIKDDTTSISNAVISGICDKTYNGKAQTQNLTLRFGSITLKSGTDYTVAYKNNTNVGTATVTITGKGNYTGVKTATFKINKASQSITASNLSLAYLKTGTITASGNKGSLSYKSSNTAIATVDSAGRVTAKGAGKATITITAAATSNYNAATKTITVTVSKATQSITASNMSLTYLKTGTITASGNKGKLSYKSSNTAIATVDTAGKVTAKGAGSAKITITAAATSNYNAATKTITVTVAKAAQSITAKAGASSIAVGKTTTVSITGAKGTKSFKSSDTTIATVTSAGKVTAKKVGTVKITATSAATANYKAASKTVTIKVVPAATTSLTAANQVTGIKLTWKKVTGANGYKVYRGTTLIKTITSGSTVTYADTKANTNGTKYVYKVIAKASTGDSTLSKTRGIYRVTRPAISSLKNSASKKMTVKWGKNAKANGYQIQYSKSKTFASGNKTATAAGASTVSKVITSLTKGKTYYVRVRAYKTVNNVKFFSSWSVVKSVKISK